MAKDLLLRMKLEDELTPKLKASLKAMEDLGKETFELRTRLTKLQDQKQGFLKGSIESDVDSLNKLKSKIAEIRGQALVADKATDRRSLTKQANVMQSDLVADYNKEMSKSKALIAANDKELKKLNFTTDRHYKQLVKQQEITKKVTVATVASTKASKANRAVVASAGNEMVRHIRRLESYAVALYTIKRGYDATLGAGHEFNKIIEQETIGLKLLISQNLKSVDTTGRAISATERYAQAQAEANKAIDIARKVNLTTPHTFKETLQIFKLLTPQVLKLGGSLEEVGTITQGMSVVAASMGIEYQQFLKTVDSALSGEMKESGLKRALEQFGVSNASIKEVKDRGDDVVAHVIKGLEQAREAGIEIFEGWAGATAQFKNEWDDLWGQAQKPLFESMKNSLKTFSKAIKENKIEILDFLEGLVKFGEVLIEIGLAYATLKITSLAYTGVLAMQTKMQKLNTMSSRIATIQTYKQGVAVSALSVKMKRLGVAFKALSTSVLPLIALTAAFETWTVVTDKQEKALEDLNKTLHKTLLDFAKMSDVKLDVATDTLKNDLRESGEEMQRLNSAIKEIQDNGKIGIISNAGDAVKALTLMERATLSAKEQVAVLEDRRGLAREHQRSIMTTLAIMGTMTDEQRDATQVQKLRNEELKDMELTILEIKREIKNATDDEKKVLEDKLEAYKKGKEHLVASKKEADRLVDSLFGAAEGAYKIADGVEAIDKGLKQATNDAQVLSRILLDGAVLRGKISDKEALTKKKEFDLANAYSEGDVGKTSQIRAKYANDLYKLNQKNAKTEKDRLSTVQDLEITKQKLLGHDEKAYQLEVARLKASDDINKGIKLEILALERAKELKDRSTSSGSKGSIIADREAKNRLTTLKEEAKQKLLLAEIDAGGSKNLSVGQRYTMRENSLQRTLALQKQIVTEAGLMVNSAKTQALYEKEITELYVIQKKLLEHQELDTFEQGLRDIFSIGKGSGGFADDFISEFSRSLETSMLNIVDMSIEGLRNGVGINETLANANLGQQAVSGLKESANPYVMAAGYAIDIATALMSDALSQEEIDRATGVQKFESQSLTNIQTILEENQAPQLTASRAMLLHLESMDDNFGSIANALSSSSGFDFDGSEFQGQSDYGFLGFSSSTEELLGAGISFGEQTIQSFLDGVDAVGYESVKVTSSSLWGLIKDEKIKITEEELSSQIKTDLSNALGDSINAVLEATEILGFDTSAIKKQLDQFALDLGKINFSDLDAEEKAKALSDAFSTQLNSAFSQAIMDIESYGNTQALDSMRQIGEDYIDTLVRVATGHEVVATQLRAFGQSVTDFVGSNALIEASGGLSSFTSAMAIFTENFFSEEEQRAMNKLALETALLKQNVLLPASKEEFKALYLTTQQKLLAVTADIEARKADIRSQIENGKYSQAIAEKRQETEQFLRDGMLLTGEAAVVAGNNFYLGMENLAGAAKEAIAFDDMTGEVSIDWDSINDAALNALEATKESLSGLLGSLSSNMSGFSDYYNDMESAASDAANALNELEKSLVSIANLKAVWGEDDISSKTIILDATKRYTGLDHLTYGNFLEEFTKVTADGLGIDSEVLGMWTDMSSAIRSLHDVEADIIKKDITFYEDILGTISNAYTGGLSYLNTREQSSYLSSQADRYLKEGATDSYLKTIESQLALDKKLSTTREDYSVKFDRYINELKRQEPEKTTDDVVETLVALNGKVDAIQNAITRSSYQASIIPTSYIGA